MGKRYAVWVFGLQVLWLGLMHGYAQSAPGNRIDAIRTALEAEMLIRTVDTAKHFNGVVTNRVATMPRADFQALTALIHDAAVARKQAVYTRSGNHHPRYYLTVTYEGGYRQIDDDGGEGSMGLELLYQRLLQLRTTLRWQEVKP